MMSAGQLEEVWALVCRETRGATNNNRGSTCLSALLTATLFYTNINVTEKERKVLERKVFLLVSRKKQCLYFIWIID